MPAETEIKLAIHDLKALRTKLSQLKVRPAFPGIGAVHEVNRLFDTPQQNLMERGQLLRIRTETPQKRASRGRSVSRAILTFKSPPAGSQKTDDRVYKVREETELTISDSPALQKIFEGLGMRQWFQYEKYRTTFRFPGQQRWAKDLLIEVDETPIGTFVELEGPEAAIDQAANRLGFSPADYIQKNYYVLYVDWCRAHGVTPSNMVFSAKRKSARHSRR